MPFYEYKCNVCDYFFEEFQPITDEPLTECPECGELIKRLISNTNAQVFRDAKELGEQIKQEAKKDIEDIRNGDIEKAADYLGEKGALEYYGNK